MKTKRKKTESESEFSPSRSDLEFDLHRLEVEWQEQPLLRQRYSEEYADARQQYERAKANVEVVVAELTDSIRTDPEKFGLEKVTEAGIKALIPKLKKHKQAKEALLIAQHYKDVLEGYLHSIDDRRKALENEVQLWLANYFAEPRVKGETNERFEEVKDERVFGNRKQNRKEANTKKRRKKQR